MLLTPYQISRNSEKPFSRYLTVAILCSDLYIIFEKFHTVGNNANVIRRIGFEKTNLKLVLDPLLALITHSLNSLLIHFYFDFIKKVNGVSIKKNTFC
jgi:hypothetical protein